jgi:hypothetical protein
VSTDQEAQRDLALDPEDAENVVGGRMLKKKAKAKAKAPVQKAVAHAAPIINIQTPTTPTEYVATDDCDPGTEPAPSSDAVPSE